MNRGKCTVLWELTPIKGAPTPQCYVRASTLPNNKEADAHDDSDDDEPTVHSLPFKVLGTCYSTSRKEALNLKAFEHMSIWTKQTHVCQT